MSMMCSVKTLVSDNFTQQQSQPSQMTNRVLQIGVTAHPQLAKNAVRVVNQNNPQINHKTQDTCHKSHVAITITVTVAITVTVTVAITITVTVTFAITITVTVSTLS